MESKILIKLQKKYEDGGYALVSEKTGKVLAYGEDIKKLYDTIERKKVDDKKGIIWFIPSPHQACVF